MSRSAKEILEEGVATFVERGSVYGDNYESIGLMLMAMFPDGLTLQTQRDFTLFHNLFCCVIKLARYSKNLKTGGHVDSAHDLMVYGALLQRATEDWIERDEARNNLGLTVEELDVLEEAMGRR